MALQSELQQSVPMSEYERLKETLESMSDEVAAMQSRQSLTERDAIENKKLYEEVRKERQELFDKCLTSEQALSDSKRDCELKEIKIKSLQNIIAKRE